MRKRTLTGIHGKLTRARWAAPVLFGSLLIAIGCTPLEPGDDVFERSGLATSDAEPPATTPVDAAWACLGKPFPMAARDPKPVTYVVAIVDFDSQPSGAMPVAGLNIVVCDTALCATAAANVTITNPVPKLPPYFYAIEVPYNFQNGYLRLTAPGYTPIDYLFGGPMVGPPEGGNTVHGAIIPLLKTGAVDLIYSQVGAGVPDGRKGMLAIRTLNCNRNPGDPRGDGQRASGVQMKVVPGTPEGATSWVLFSNNYASKDFTETDARGVAGLVNVPAQSTIALRGVAPVGGPKGTEFGSVALPVRAGVVTIAEVRPGLDQWGQ